MISGIHTIAVYEIFQGKRKLLSTCIFGIDKRLNYEKEELDSTGYIIYVESELLDNPIIEEVDADTYEKCCVEICDNEKKYGYYILRKRII